MAEPAVGWYLYCVLDAAARPPLDGLVGVDGAAPIEPVDETGLRALASRVPLSEFGEEPLRRNLEDLAWVERTARAHDAVLARTLACDAVVPLRMFTIFAGEPQVRAMLADERAALTAALRRLRGHAEWSVKARVDERRLEAVLRGEGGAGAAGAGAAGAGAAGAGAGGAAGAGAAGAGAAGAGAGGAAGAGAAGAGAAGAGAGAGGADAAGAGGAGAETTPGRAFFARKQADRGLRERALERIADIAEEIHARLSEAASAETLLPPQRRELSRLPGTMVLNGAYLVARERDAAFSAAVTELSARHRAEGFAIDVSGPWAPYNFAKPGAEDEQRAPAPGR
ncbi:GvpL/GvpF family gas vesicle protein [Conexibacter arvalis]|uniref:Gas vesicle synthesis protein GvpL/GvpF n=1 Tax=Conexibacter arvalis TaxID=912552 RepID=A0A840IDB4_9ACTN|nr:GvpL/GvpF family gas vesicle protein [Conexibacter arvalis]MBB4662241.1 hypothetical protein [Conexibacter arvalis]